MMDVVRQQWRRRIASPSGGDTVRFIRHDGDLGCDVHFPDGYIKTYSTINRAFAALQSHMGNHIYGHEKVEVWRHGKLFTGDQYWTPPRSVAEVLENQKHGVRKVASGFEGETYNDEGEVGNRSHITRVERGTVPTSSIAHLQGVEGEQPGQHRNRQGERWQQFLDDIHTNGIREPIFITVDYNEKPKISEGNHRRDAAVELGMERVPVEIRYYGHAERQGSVA
jgi:hypothetical protein